MPVTPSALSVRHGDVGRRRVLPPRNARYRKLVTIVVEKRGVMQRARPLPPPLPSSPPPASYTIPPPRSPRPISQSCNHNQLEIIDFLGRPRTRLAGDRSRISARGWTRRIQTENSRFSRSIEFIFLQCIRETEMLICAMRRRESIVASSFNSS